MSDKLSPEAAFRGRIIEDVRPWGKFRRFPHEGASSIKIITVEPGGRLSLQYHNGRDEFWVVLDPGLEITVGERVWRDRSRRGDLHPPRHAASRPERR